MGVLKVCKLLLKIRNVVKYGNDGIFTYGHDDVNVSSGVVVVIFIYGHGM
jgi:hypothetical protein